VQRGRLGTNCDRHREVTREALRVAFERGVDSIGLPMTAGSLVIEDQHGAANRDPPQ